MLLKDAKDDAQKQEKTSAPGADMICGRSSSCRASHALNLTVRKLGLTTVRPRLQSAPEPPALPQICGNFLRFLTSGDLDL